MLSILLLISRFNVIDALIADPYLRYPKRPIPMYRTTIKAKARLKTPVTPTYDLGVLISFSSGIIYDQFDNVHE